MPVPTDEITRERLERWSQKLEKEHATPMCLVGVGHDQKSGQLVVCLPDGPQMTNQLVANILRAAARIAEMS